MPSSWSGFAYRSWPQRLLRIPLPAPAFKRFHSSPVAAVPCNVYSGSGQAVQFLPCLFATDITAGPLTPPQRANATVHAADWHCLLETHPVLRILFKTDCGRTFVTARFSRITGLDSAQRRLPLPTRPTFTAFFTHTLCAACSGWTLCCIPLTCAFMGPRLTPDHIPLP